MLVSGVTTVFCLLAAQLAAAASLPDQATVFVPANGTATGSDSGLSAYGVNQTDVAPGAYYESVYFELRYPNGTSTPGGGVYSSTCRTIGGTTGTFYFNNTQAGVYNLGVNATVATPRDETCLEFGDVQSTYFNVTFELVDSNSNPPTSTVSTKLSWDSTLTAKVNFGPDATRPPVSSAKHLTAGLLAVAPVVFSTLVML